MVTISETRREVLIDAAYLKRGPRDGGGLGGRSSSYEEVLRSQRHSESKDGCELHVGDEGSEVIIVLKVWRTKVL